MNVDTTTPAVAPATAAPRHELYVPGHAGAKLLMALLGATLLTLSLVKYAPVFRLAVSGGSVMAETTRILLIDSAGTETVLNNDVEVKAKVEELEKSKDRSLVFWTEYRFTTETGAPVTARSPIGQVMKPLHDIRDQDGLPFSIRLWYDKAAPQHVIIPFQFLPGTWMPFGFGTYFIPGMLFIFGLAGLWVGLLLWKNANKPIEMPDLSQAHGESETKRLPAGGH